MITINRTEHSDHGTIGELIIDGEPFCWTIELPDRGNRPNVSRIPAGVYSCSWGVSPMFGWVYTVDNVPGRSLIRIHNGNYAGDTVKGYRTHSHGCIILGARKGWLNRQRVVLASRPTRRRFEQALGGWPFTLQIAG